MGKNDTLADSLSGEVTISRDESFKDIIRYKAIAAIIIKYAIPDFKDMSLVEIAKHIVDDKPRKENQSNSDILDQEIDFIPSETGTKDEKNTIFDAAFRIRRRENIENIQLKFLDSMYTVNTEMQNETSETKLGYNIISRAIYYGATLLRGTVPAGDTKYRGIHKVYTIWLCMNNLGDMGQLPNGKIQPELRTKPIHKYNFRRSYDDIPSMVVGKEPESDLIEVIMIEVKKLSSIGSGAEDLLHTLFYNAETLVDKIERTEVVSLAKVKKGVHNMVNAEEYYKHGKQEGMAKGIAKGEEKREVDMLVRYIERSGLKGKAFDTVKSTLSQIWDCSEHSIEEAYRIANSN